ncbi:MAG: NifU family protein [Acidobacteria bacterium]|nr:NifU family protein [Acidobacteriota bacterium]MBI3658745.1 NifU family protein [Acidobacteriota bacterium]
MAKQVGAAIRAQLQSGIPAVSEKHKEKLPSSAELRLRVKDILDNDINPAVAGHGGFVELLDVRANNIYIRMGGGCQGCGMANVTLKQGIERTLRDAIPEIGEILDTTDHASGHNPYYSPSK